ncbi:MAG: FAD-dependent oxidoreductase [Candidatus Marsarchaeota archaeon]|nr:FAD-dependent oxidoreductase [Candidatus Marsarchaeota archaeon]
MANYPIVERKYFVSEKIDETPEVLIVGFRPEDGKPSAFDPGMFMMISGIDKQTGEKHTARAMSIASDPSSPNMEFFVIKNPTHGDHIGKSHFLDIEINDPFLLKGPNGQFKFDVNKDPKVLFIAGGTGLSPFMSMLRHMKIVNAQNDIIMLYSVKYPTEIIKKNELAAFEQQLKLKTIVTVTRPADGDGWTGQTGHVDSAMIQKYAPDFPDRMCYVCGPLPFVKAIKDALAQLNVPTQRISADVWG